MNHLYPTFKPARSWLVMLSLLVYGLAAMAQPPQACRCVWQGSFSQSQRDADVVVVGEIIGRKGNSADLKIFRRYPNRPGALADYVEVLRFWGNNGQLCRPDISLFEPGSQWVLALNSIDAVPADGFNPNTPSISFGREGDYSLSKCGANWLRIHEDFVSGNLVDGTRWTWQSPNTHPVLLELVESYLRGDLSEEVLKQAASTNNRARQLMLQTRIFLRQQQRTGPE